MGDASLRSDLPHWPRYRQSQAKHDGGFGPNDVGDDTSELIWSLRSWDVMARVTCLRRLACQRFANSDICLSNRLVQKEPVRSSALP
jgi:hypothetical protein